MNKYFKNIEKINDGKSKPFIYKVEEILKTKKGIVKEFDNWFIIENEFPYDAFCEVSHMILTKNKKKFDWGFFNKRWKWRIIFFKEELYLWKLWCYLWEFTFWKKSAWMISSTFIEIKKRRYLINKS